VSTFQDAAAELAGVAERMHDADLLPTVRAITGARRIMLYGCGREGLMMRALAMRLHHLGLDVCMQGDMTAFPLGPGDLFLCAAGPGTLPTASTLCGVARSAGARVLVVTAEPQGATAKMADELLVIPAQTMAGDIGGTSVLPMGSLFEGAMFLVFEVLILELRDSLGQTPESMRGRHTNME
jgi:6-phospho-3-hexuloisomerase